MTSERIHFRIFQMPCCKHIICWVNSRKPSYCPECGSMVMGRELGLLLEDTSATLKYEAK